MTLLQNKFLLRIKSSVLLIFFSLIFISCQTLQDYTLTKEEILSQINEELQNFGFSQKDFSDFSIYICRLDLDSLDFQLICNIDTKNSFTVEDFAKETGAKYAINTTPFDDESSEQIKIQGITKFNDQILSSAIEKYSALGFFYNSERKLRAAVIQNQTDEEIQKYPAAFGGFFTILKNQEILEYEANKNSRIACGIDESGRYLYILGVISKRIFGKSGMTYMECAELLLNSGCTDAMEFDGGHSSAFVFPQTGYIHSPMNRKIPAAIGFYFKD